MKTDLTTTQQHAAGLLAQGKTVTDTATELQVAETDILHWMRRPEFEAYENRTRTAAQFHTRQRLLSLTGQAMETVAKCLQSEREAVALRAAQFVIEHVSSLTVGETDPEIIEQERRLKADKNSQQNTWIVDETVRDETEYERLCRKFAIDP